MTAIAAVPATVLATLAEMVEARTGLRFVESRRAELDIKLSRLYHQTGAASWEAYLDDLASEADTALFERLVEALTVGETHFFRHRAHFNVLESTILPERIASRGPTRQLRIWSAGCASGEEAYSIAILARRLLPDADWRIDVLGTDLNRSFLRQAEEGSYRAWSFREMDPAAEPWSFIAEGSGHRVRPEVRRLVRFAYHNLALDTPPPFAFDLDVILCRNVLMYFRAELAREVISRLREALGVGGWLVLGLHDVIAGSIGGFDTYNAPGAVVYRRPLPERDAGPPSPATLGWPATSVPSGHAAFAADPDTAPSAAANGSRASTRLEPAADGETSEPHGDWRVAWERAYASASSGKPGEAEELCQVAIARAPQHPEPYYLLGALRQEAGDDDGALAAFRQSLYVDRGFVPALLALATLHRRAGQPARARQALARAERSLNGRAADEIVLAEEGLTVGRLRDSLERGLALECRA